MALVYWTPSNPSLYFDRMHPYFSNFKEVYYINQNPRPYLQYLFEKRGTEDEFTTCPAFLDYFKNTYVITAPFDFTIDYTKGKLVFTDCTPEQQLYLKSCSLDRTQKNIKNYLPVISCAPSYIVYSDSSVMMEVSQLHFTDSDCNFHYVPGMYDISKWIRPIDLTFEIKDPLKPLVFKRGDPLFLIRFIPQDRTKVEMIRVEEDKELENLVKGAVRVKAILPKLSLNKLYSLASPIMSLFLKKNKAIKQESKCPFNKMFRK